MLRFLSAIILLFFCYTTCFHQLLFYTACQWFHYPPSNVLFVFCFYTNRSSHQPSIETHFAVSSLIVRVFFVSASDKTMWKTMDVFSLFYKILFYTTKFDIPIKFLLLIMSVLFRYSIFIPLLSKIQPSDNKHFHHFQ